MKHDIGNSAASSAATSRPQTDRGATGASGEAKLGESAFLRRESEQAKSAASAALADAMRDVGRGVDLRAWTAAHPWVALGAAAVGGFVAATQLVPSRDQQMLRKLEQIRDAVLGESREEKSKPADSTDHHDKKKGKGLFGIIGTELVKFLGPALSSALSAAITGRTVAQAADQAQDGASHSQYSSGNASDPASVI